VVDTPVSLGYRLREALYCGGVLAVAAVFGLYLKSVILQRSSGYLAISRHLGRSGEEDFSWAERAAFYREDILIFGGGSLALAVFITLFPRPWRPWILALLAVSVVMYYFMALMAYANVGTFLTFSLAVDGARWLTAHPEDLRNYLSLSALIKLISIQGGVLGLVFLGFGIREHVAARIRTFTATAYLLTLLVSVGLVLIGTVNTVDAAPAYKSSTRSTLTALLSASSGSGRYAKADLGAVGAAYQALSRTPVSPERDSLFGAAPRKDIILFILETAPRRALSGDGSASLTELAGLGTGSVLYSDGHHSTYPYTSDAMYSIFTSTYPIDRIRMLESGSGVAALGWPTLLQEKGYITKQYSPFGDAFENDTALFKKAGFDQRYISPKFSGTESDPVVVSAKALLEGFPSRDIQQDGRTLSLLASDLKAWERLRADVLSWKSSDVRFAVAFAPQVGHGPWPRLLDSRNALDQGGILIALQLAWLRDFLKQLAADGYLENTIVVITGDHGPRTKTEYPELEGGVLTEISLNVPFALFAPGVFPGKVKLAHATSHVDIGPSLLWLLGIEDTRPVSHGFPMWTPMLSERRLFGFGRDYLGADSIITRTDWVSCSTLSERCSQMNDGAKQAGAQDMPAQLGEESRDRIQGMEEIQRRITELLTNKGG